MVQGEMEVSGLNSATSEDTASQTIEMRENETSYAPPVHAGPRVITSQPHGEVRQPTRPTPQNSLDWVPTPMSQLSTLSGTYSLGNVDQLEIQQIVDLSTLLGRSDRRFQYRIRIPKAETLFLATESRSESQSNPFSCSTLIHEDFTLNVLDRRGMSGFVMKMNTRWTYSFNRLHKITVGNENLIGTVEENFGVIGAKFTVYDETRKKLCNIVGPNVCGCCMYQEAQFQVITIDGTHQIATLMHQWDDITRDYTFLATFPADLNIKLKSLLLAAVFLLEHMYFERIRRTSRI
ncbi:phospholipid scramblase 2 isoform X3 [Nomia melanderi]|uniref:phospholipid scramblase 2 isoform X3 n=2 Tax=Nomia melanderi TaxID=2448451 RepID=UPI001303F6D7|nr:phospholipid scramblase 2 isoform X2 [Nomia melanderi]